MDLPFLSEISEALSAFGQFVLVTTYKVFVTPSGGFSFASLVCSTLVALAYLYITTSRNRRRPLKLKVLMRAFFPKRILSSRSTRADVMFMFLNIFIFSIISSGAIMSHLTVSAAVQNFFLNLAGPVAPTALPDAVTALIATAAIYFAYEIGYYADHYLSHNVPFLWEFHKVHHTAEVLTPMTNARVHPFDTLLFFNILALTMGGTTGILTYLFGKPSNDVSIYGVNAFFLMFYFVIGHLQHSHFWIVFPGIWGRIILSPAHHQIHHSTNPAHFNKNLGNFTGFLDWMFGTLYVPGPKREKLVFGIVQDVADPNTISETLIAPVINAAGHLKPQPRKPQNAVPA